MVLKLNGNVIGRGPGKSLLFQVVTFEIEWFRKFLLQFHNLHVFTSLQPCWRGPLSWRLGGKLAEIMEQQIWECWTQKNEDDPRAKRCEDSHFHMVLVDLDFFKCLL